MTETYAEVTMLNHAHGGPGWEIGRCLWSPVSTSSSQDRYAIMREPAYDDAVYHWVAGVPGHSVRHRFLWGVSRVKSSAKTAEAPPPDPGQWAGRPAYYRIELTDFRRFDPAIDLHEIERGLSDLIMRELEQRPKHFPYVAYQSGFRIAQGIYLTRLGKSLSEAIEYLSTLPRMTQHSSEMTAEHSPTIRLALEAEAYAEGERSRREIQYFRRNHKLRKAALGKHGLSCVVCGFDFGETYGEHGRGFVELHHLQPLAERKALAGQPTTTTVDDVVPLCANCHRMVHRTTPALSISDLKQLIGRETQPD